MTLLFYPIVYGPQSFSAAVLTTLGLTCFHVLS